MAPPPPSDVTKEFHSILPLRSREDELLNNILPSYHMFQSTISKNLTPTDENYRVDPPIYEVTPVSTNATTSPITSAVQTPRAGPSRIAGPSGDGYPFPNQPFSQASILNESASNLSSTFSSDPVQLYPQPSQASTFNAESADIWENTILANAHKLPNLSDANHEFSKNLEIDIKVTDKVCQKGVKPDIIDPSQFEYKQGDYLHGYVTITNRSKDPIPFDMVYVVFEGSLVVLDHSQGLIDSQQPVNVYKFLNMTDLFASWSFANIDRLVTDNGDPHDWCEGETDPYDNTCLSIDVKRFFQPNITYKRFFTFRVPEKLLDDACEFHNFGKHSEVPPSLGVARDMKSIPLMYLSNTSKNANKIKDFSFIDTYINYSVDARIIGKASEYKDAKELKLRSNKPKDRYVIAKELICPIRVVPLSYNHDEYLNPRNEEITLFYRAFVDSVKNKIAYGLETLANMNNDNHNIISPYQSPESVSLFMSNSALSPSNSTDRLKQLYSAANTTAKESILRQFKNLALGNVAETRGLNDEDYDDNAYQFMTPYKKKSLTGSLKVLGILSLSTPKQEYKSLYVPPLRYRDRNQSYNNNISIPVEIAFFYEPKTSGKQVSCPDIKLVTCELVSLTIRSKKYEIPIEFNHEMCFRDRQIVHNTSTPSSSSSSLFSNAKHEEQEINDFDSITIKPFQGYYNKLLELIRKFGNDPNFRVETQLFRDVKAMAFLQTKFINLNIANPKFYTQSKHNRGIHQNLNNIEWKHTESTTNKNYSYYTKKFDISLDLNGCHTKGTDPPKDCCFDHFTLVPNFQTCFMTRMYYIKIRVKMTNGTQLEVNVPLSIEN